MRTKFIFVTVVHKQYVVTYGVNTVLVNDTDINQIIHI